MLAIDGRGGSEGVYSSGVRSEGREVGEREEWEVGDYGKVRYKVRDAFLKQSTQKAQRRSAEGTALSQRNVQAFTPEKRRQTLHAKRSG